MLPKRESQRHKDAFEFYYSMPKRSKAKVAERFSISVGAVDQWSRAFDWPKRIQKRDEKAKEKTEEKVTDAIAKMNARHIKAWGKIQRKALKELRQLVFEKAIEATKGYDTAVDGERKARGVPTDYTEHSGKFVVEFEMVRAPERKRKRTDGEND